MARHKKKYLFFGDQVTATFCCSLTELGEIMRKESRDFVYGNHVTSPDDLKQQGACYAVTKKYQRKIWHAMRQAKFVPLVQWMGNEDKEVVLWFRWPHRSRRRRFMR